MKHRLCSLSSLKTSLSCGLSPAEYSLFFRALWLAVAAQPYLGPIWYIHLSPLSRNSPISDPTISSPSLPWLRHEPVRLIRWSDSSALDVVSPGVSVSVIVFKGAWVCSPLSLVFSLLLYDSESKLAISLSFCLPSSFFSLASLFACVCVYVCVWLPGWVSISHFSFF